MIALSFLGHQRVAGNQAVSARQIADQFGLPLPLLMNVLKSLAHAQIVESTRGAQGGYELAVDPHEVSLLEIVTAIEGPFQLVQCCSDAIPMEKQTCKISEQCPIRHPLQRLHQRIHEFFERVTLADLIESKVDVPLACMGTQQ